MYIYYFAGLYVSMGIDVVRTYRAASQEGL